jgi:hypothetical protein
MKNYDVIVICVSAPGVHASVCWRKVACVSFAAQWLSTNGFTPMILLVGRGWCEPTSEYPDDPLGNCAKHFGVSRRPSG